MRMPNIGKWRRVKPSPPSPPPKFKFEFRDGSGTVLYAWETEMLIKDGDTLMLYLDDCIVGRDDDGVFIKVRPFKVGW